MISGAGFAVHQPRQALWPGLHPALRLAGLLLLFATCLVGGPPLLLVLLVLGSVCLSITGLGPRSQLATLRPWLAVGLFIVTIHAFTHTATAALGTFTWQGVLAGLSSLLRVGGTVIWLGVYVRSSSVDELVLALRWWLRPLERLGFPGQDLGLTLAVALGTVPAVLSEGRRIEAAVRLRRSGPAGTFPSAGNYPGQKLVSRVLDRARITVPLMEALGRRAESLSLSLRSRRPGSEIAGWTQPPLWGLLVAVGWLVLLVLAVMGRGPLG